jgi:16S rRNA (cytosine967-C5)-methyltransferase
MRMPHPSHFRAAAELLQAILAGTLPADAQAKRYFRAHPKMGARDRAEVTEVVYGCLRHKRLLEHLCGGGDPRCLTAAQWLRAGADEHALEEAVYADAVALAERVRTLEESALPFAVRYSLPDLIAERLLAQYGETEAAALTEALNRPATVDLRVNTRKSTREEVQARLAEEGLTAEPTPYSPVGLRRALRAPLTNTRAFRAGLFEAQDEGSQLLSLLLEPRRRETVADFCAGAGGKALHLGALMADTGTVYAFDISAKRLAKLKPRLERAGLHNVRPLAIAHERDERVRRLAGKIDRVLVDAPCSGVGTLRRNPDIKWRAINLPELVDAQKRILAAAATLVKPGGRLVYATCSLLREENEDIVAGFLAAHGDFRVIPAAEILARRHIALPLAPPPHPSPVKREGELEEAGMSCPPHPSPVKREGELEEAGMSCPPHPSPALSLTPSPAPREREASRGARGARLFTLGESAEAALRLFPHRHGTDGFYAVALERASGGSRFDGV